MQKRGCLNCHFFCVDGFDFGHDGPVINSVDDKYRDREALTEFLNKRWSSRVRAIKCSRGKWDSERIGKENITEITNAIFSPERSTCDCFVEYEKHADQEAPKETEERKRSAREMRITWTLSIIALLIALSSLVIAWLAYLKP